jgi:hypothetical protein
MNIRPDPRTVENHQWPAGDPKWATALIVGIVSVATLAITRSPQDVPIVAGVVLVALGVAPRGT